jgi:hypothetical protein
MPASTRERGVRVDLVLLTREDRVQSPPNSAGRTRRRGGHCPTVLTIDSNDVDGIVRKLSPSSSGSTIRAVTRNSAGTLLDIPFDIVVFC